MTDCSETEIRDLLPDYVTGSLSAAETEMVAMHLASCAACADEVALLRMVRSVRPVPMALDVGAMVARISEQAGVAPASSSAPDIRSITSARSRQRTVRYGSWRWAAAITVIAVGGLSAIIAHRGQQGMLPVASVDSLMPGSAATPARASTGIAASSQPASTRSATARAAASGERAALSVGELSDYSDAELEGVIKKLEAWDGTASPDPLLPVPLVKPSGGAP